jgi:hypothetical protein
VAQLDEFTPVPYALPLAPGEFVRVVDTELSPADLLRLGLPVENPAEVSVPAELLVSEVGETRAVRLQSQPASLEDGN